MTKGWVKENGVFFLSAGDTVVAPHCSFAVAGWRRRKRWGAITCKWQRFRALCLQSQGNYSHMRPARRILSGSSGEKKVKLLSNFLIFFSPPPPPLLELFLSAHNHKFFTITFFFFKDLKRLANEERGRERKKKLINNCWSVTTFEVPKVCHYHLLWGHIKTCISWHINCANWSFALTFWKSFFVSFCFDSVIISSSWKGHRFVSHLKVFPLSDVSLWQGVWPARVSAGPHVLAEKCRPLVDDINHSSTNTACCPNGAIFVCRPLFFLKKKKTQKTKTKKQQKTPKQFISPQVKIYLFTVQINPKSKVRFLPDSKQYIHNFTALFFPNLNQILQWTAHQLFPTEINRLFADLW